MTGSAVMTGEEEMTVGKGVAPETCSSSLGTSISALAGAFQVCDVVCMPQDITRLRM